MRKNLIVGASVVVLTAGVAQAQSPSPFGAANSLTVPVYSTSFSTPFQSSLTGTATNESAAAFEAGWYVTRSASNANTFDNSVKTGHNFVAGGTRFGPTASFQASGQQLFNPAGIAASPLGTQVGVALTAHDLIAAATPNPADVGTTTSPQGIALVNTNPINIGSSSRYAIRFNLWANFTPGGTATSEFVFFGVGAPAAQASIGALATGSGGTASAPTAGVGPITSGTTFTITGDGGFARDLRVFNGTSEEIADANWVGKNVINGTSGFFDTVAQDALNPAYNTAPNSAFPTAGVPGNSWLDITIFSDQTGSGETTYYINGVPIYSRTGFTPLGNVFVGYMDMNGSISPQTSNTYAFITDYRVVIPEPTTLGLLAGAAVVVLRRKRA
jgi:hypothetical protein